MKFLSDVAATIETSKKTLKNEAIYEAGSERIFLRNLKD
jgi:hypothetical protein